MYLEVKNIKLQVGIPKLDEALRGGLERGEITLIYGEPGSGKTALMLQIALQACLQGFKALCIYSDGLFPYPRLEIIMRKMGLNESSVPLQVIHINHFEDLKNIVRQIELGNFKDYYLIAFDTLTGPYRSIPIERRQEVIAHNKMLNQLMAILKNYAQLFNAYLVLTSRLRSPSISGESTIDEPIASNVLTYWSDNIISLSKLDLPYRRRIVILKSHGMEANVEIKAHIVDGMLEEVD